MLGIDIIEIDRISEIVKADHGNRFLEKVYTANELAYCKKDAGYKYNSLAARFAAKEAVAKALGTGLKEFTWKDIEIINDQSGKPEVYLFNKAKIIAEKLKVSKAHISLSHTHTLAFASCYLEFKK